MLCFILAPVQFTYGTKECPSTPRGRARETQRCFARDCREEEASAKRFPYFTDGARDMSLTRPRTSTQARKPQ